MQGRVEDKGQEVQWDGRGFKEAISMIFTSIANWIVQGILKLIKISMPRDCQN